MCGFCNVWLCECVRFVMCGCVYVWVWSVWLCLCAFCNVWVCKSVGFLFDCACVGCVMCGCVYVWFL